MSWTGMTSTPSSCPAPPAPPTAPPSAPAPSTPPTSPRASSRWDAGPWGHRGSTGVREARGAQLDTSVSPPCPQGGPLSFSPGAVYAEDGDRGLRAAITYSLLAGKGGHGGTRGAGTHGHGRAGRWAHGDTGTDAWAGTQGQGHHDTDTGGQGRGDRDVVAGDMAGQGWPWCPGWFPALPCAPQSLAVPGVPARWAVSVVIGGPRAGGPCAGGVQSTQSNCRLLWSKLNKGIELGGS